MMGKKKNSIKNPFPNMIKIIIMNDANIIVVIASIHIDKGVKKLLLKINTIKD